MLRESIHCECVTVAGSFVKLGWCRQIKTLLGILGISNNLRFISNTGSQVKYASEDSMIRRKAIFFT